MYNPNVKTLVIDLDGTLCEQTAGGEEYFTARPLQPMIDQVKEYKAAGWNIVIFTARGMRQFNGDMREAFIHYGMKTTRWLREHDVPFDVLQFGKPSADMYVDDKGVDFHDFLTKPV